MKKQLNWHEEFEITKLILDKFLWIGFAMMLFGLYNVLLGSSTLGFYSMAVGATVLIIFLVVILKIYEPPKK
ncbi:MAG: hypothetical protein NTV63_05460 [Candidatus Woesearchaeota archaeon]|nr:hypothetical protein [Candidatus Woesearchaeota archaeon]